MIKRGEELARDMQRREFIGIDGLPSTPEQEARLNELIGRLFTSDAFTGEQALAYLKRISINRIMPAGTSGEVLQHMEGQRWLVGVLQGRLEAYRRGPKPTPKPRGRIGRKDNV